MSRPFSFAYPLKRAAKSLCALSAASGLVVVPGSAFAQTGPQLIVSGPQGAIPFDSPVDITAQVKSATGVPLYQFWLNHRLLRGYSRNSRAGVNGLPDGITVWWCIRLVRVRPGAVSGTKLGRPR